VRRNSHREHDQLIQGHPGDPTNPRDLVLGCMLLWTSGDVRDARYSSGLGIPRFAIRGDQSGDQKMLVSMRKAGSIVVPIGAKIPARQPISISSPLLHLYLPPVCICESGSTNTGMNLLEASHRVRQIRFTWVVSGVRM
jgi:hypothetical protein